MTVSRVNSFSYLFVLLAFLVASNSANGGQYVYGISDDSKIHQVDLTSYIDTVVFDTGGAGLLNGVGWAGKSNKVYYRNPENGLLYFWSQTTNSGGYVVGEKLPGINSNASFYKDDYWYVEDGSDTLVRATIFPLNPSNDVIGNVYTFDNFDGSALTGFLFGDIAISKAGILYGSSNNGLFSVDISGPTPSQFKILSSNFAVLQISFDPTETFLYGQDYATGKWYKVDLNGVETPLYTTANVPFSSTPLRDLGAVLTTVDGPFEATPEPTSWQLLISGVGYLVMRQFRQIRIEEARK